MSARTTSTADRAAAQRAGHAPSSPGPAPRPPAGALALVGAEFAKFFGTRTWLWSGLLLGALAFGATALVGVAAPYSDPPLPGLDTAAGVGVATGLLGMLVIVPALVGITAMGGEHQHGTAVPTFLAVPRRGRVLAAKLAAFTAVGAGYGTVAAVSGAAGIALASALTGTPLGAPAGAITAALAGTALAMTAYTLIGVAVGALLRNQLAALAALGAYLYFIDPVLTLLPVLGPVQPFLPRGATDALTGAGHLAAETAAQTGIPAPDLLPVGAAAAVLAAYALLAAAIAVALPMRRDVR